MSLNLKDPTKYSGLGLIRYAVGSLQNGFGVRFFLVENSKELHENSLGTKRQFLTATVGLNRTNDILVLMAVSARVTVIGSAAVILWTRIVRHGWPDRAVIFSTAIGLLGFTVLSVLAYLILEH